MLVVLCAIALVVVLGIPLVKGDQLYAVQTGSMEPTYPIGSIVVVEPVEAAQVKVGDVITYQSPGFQTPVTHRVMDIDAENQQMYTKGDNNANVDFYPVDFVSVRGRVSYGIPILGNIVSGIRTPGGILVIAWVVLGIILLLVLPDLLEKRKKLKQEERLQAEQNRQAHKEHQFAQPDAAPERQVYRAENPVPVQAAGAADYQRKGGLQT